MLLQKWKRFLVVFEDVEIVLMNLMKLLLQDGYFAFESFVLQS